MLTDLRARASHRVLSCYQIPRWNSRWTIATIGGGGPCVWVADAGHSQIIQLNTALSSATTNIAGIAANGLAVDGFNNVYATTSNSVTEVTGTIAIPGPVNPTGIAIDSTGNLWVADTGNKQVEEFQVGMFNQVPLAIFNDNGLLNSPKGIAVDASGNIYVTDSAANQVIKFTP